MTTSQEMILIGLCALATIITRFLPFIIFTENRETPEFIAYIRDFLPSAVFGMLVIYCLRNVSFVTGTHWIPEALAIVATIGIHLWKRQTLLSIATGTFCYMLLIHFVF